jgi:hypothetical protein
VRPQQIDHGRAILYRQPSQGFLPTGVELRGGIVSGRTSAVDNLPPANFS